MSKFLPGELEPLNAKLPLENPTNILQQPKSDITTNPYIKEAKIDQNQTFNQININTSIAFMGLLDDLLNKPDNVYWNDYLLEIINKDQRYNYISVLLFFIALYILLLR